MRSHTVYHPFVSIILPTFCEEENIVPLIQAISSVLQKEKKSFEILIVDDNSPDKTQQHVLVYAKKHPEIRLLVRKKNPSLGLSIGLGMKEAVGDVVVGMDADFNHDPKTIPLLLHQLEQGYDLAVASRFVRGGGMEDKIRFFPTLFFNVFFRCLGFPVMDATSGFYAIRRDHLKKMGIHSIYYGYGDYHLRLVYAAKRQGLRICEVPTFYALRRSGSSKSRLLKMAVSYVKEAVRIVWSR